MKICFTTRAIYVLFFVVIGLIVWATPAAATGTPQQAAAAASAADLWRLVVYPPNAEGVDDEINGFIREGYIPVGVEIEPGESLSFLLVKSGRVDVAGWLLLEYTDWSTLETEITSGITSGLVPMDITRFGERIAVLWVEAPLPIDGWRIHVVANGSSERVNAVNQFQAEGFTLWGFSVHKEEAWFLFIKQPGSEPAGAITSVARDAGALRTAISRSTADGWLPYGLGIDGSQFYVSFIR